MPEIRTQAGAKITVEMRAADVICIPGKWAVIDQSIEPRVRSANTANKLPDEMFAYAWSPNPIKIPEYRAIRLQAIESLTPPPEQFALDSDAAVHQEVGTEAGIGSATQTGVVQSVARV